MSHRGTSYWDMATDAGAATDEEKEQMAQMIEDDHLRQAEEAALKELDEIQRPG